MDRFVEAASDISNNEGEDVVVAYCRSSPECEEVLQVLDVQGWKGSEVSAVPYESPLNMSVTLKLVLKNSLVNYPCYILMKSYGDQVLYGIFFIILIDLYLKD